MLFPSKSSFDFWVLDTELDINNTSTPCSIDLSSELQLIMDQFQDTLRKFEPKLLQVYGSSPYIKFKLLGDERNSCAHLPSWSHAFFPSLYVVWYPFKLFLSVGYEQGLTKSRGDNW